MKISVEVKKTYCLTLTEEEMSGLMRIFGKVRESDFDVLCIREEVKTSLGKLYSEWYRND